MIQQCAHSCENKCPGRPHHATLSINLASLACLLVECSINCVCCLFSRKALHVAASVNSIAKSNLD